MTQGHIKFKSIESLERVVHGVNYSNTTAAEANVPLPYSQPITFHGTVKLHGTNAGIRINVRTGDVVAQSRSRDLTIEKDNFGFAQFVKQREDLFRDLARQIIPEENTRGMGEVVMLYGEWIGPGIQKAVAINQLAERQLVLFSAGCTTEEGEFEWSSDAYLKRNLIPLLREGVYSVTSIPSFSITIDFQDSSSLQQAALFCDALTLAVEDGCPWAKKFGVEGLGEGIVWKPDPIWGMVHSNLWFKTKGPKHRTEARKEPKRANITPEDIQGLHAFADFAVTNQRLVQGLAELKEQGFPLTVQSTGEYLKWVCKDILKECEGEIVQAKLSWKQASRIISTRAREFFFRAIRQDLPVPVVEEVSA